MAARVQVQALRLAEVPAAEHVGVEETAAAAAVVLGIAGEFVVVAALVHRGRRIVVVLLVVDVVVEGTGAQHRTVVVLAHDHLGQGADLVGGQAVLVEVAVAVVGVAVGGQLPGRLVHAHANAVAGGEVPVQRGAIVEIDGIPRQRAGRVDGQCHCSSKAGQRPQAPPGNSRQGVVVIVHPHSPHNSGRQTFLFSKETAARPDIGPARRESPPVPLAKALPRPAGGTCRRRRPVRAPANPPPPGS
ncbi:hypothetical protein D3C76_553860 [compost metagenome]